MTSYCGQTGLWTGKDSKFDCPSPNSPLPYPQGFFNDETCHEKRLGVSVDDYNSVYNDDEEKYGSELGADGNPATYYMSKKAPEEYIFLLFNEE